MSIFLVCLQEVEFVGEFYGGIFVNTLTNQESKFVSVLAGGWYSDGAL